MLRAAIITALFSIAIAGCSSVPQALDELRPGMDKDEVLSNAGNPTRTFREKNQDHWIYVYYKGDQQWLRDVMFEDGKVTTVTRPAATKEAWVKELERTETLEEYEKKAREHQQQQKKSGGR